MPKIKNRVPERELATTDRIICIAGFAETTREYANKEADEVEIWSLNRCYSFLRRWDRHYEVHEEELYSGKTGLREPEYMDLMKSSAVPVYMQHPDPENFPNAKAIPTKEIVAAGFRNYFTTSIAHMLAHAAYEHKVLGMTVKEVRIYGVDMSAYQEYSYQRPCVEYWCGVLDGLGIAYQDRRTVVVPTASPMLKSAATYGSHSERALWAQANERIKNFKSSIAELAANVQALTGAVGEYANLPKHDDPQYAEKLKARHRELSAAHAQFLADLNATMGAQRECQHWLTAVGAPQSEEHEPETIKLPTI